MDCTLIYKDKDYTHEEFFKYIDEHQDEFKVKETSYQLKGTESSKASPATVKLVKEFFDRIGFKLKDSLTDIVDSEGNKVDANASVNLFTKVVSVINGAEATTLPEEAMHVVSAILKEKDPVLFKDMMNKIGNYTLFQDVMGQYKDNPEYQIDGKPNISKIKEEAVGKILAEYVIKNNEEQKPEKPELIAQVQTWWSRIKDSIKNLLGIAKIDPFDIASKDFISGKITTDKNADLGKDTFLQQKDKGAELFKNISEQPEPIKVEDGKGNSHYEVEGKTVKNRVTDYPQSFLEHTFRNKPNLKDKIQDAVNEQKMAFGIGGHADIEHMLETGIDKATGLPFSADDHTLRIHADNYVSKMNPNDRISYDLIQRHLFGYDNVVGGNIAHVPGLIESFPAGTRFMWEKKIYDPKRDLAGTIDFLAIEPSGKVNILDWKFTGKLEQNQSIRDYMKKAYDIQMSHYKGILQQQYGVAEVGKVRIIPISVTYSDKGAFEKLRIGDADYNAETTQFLLPYPTSSESTGDKKLDTLISNLGGIIDQLSSKSTTGESKESRDLKIKNIEKAILSLRLTKTFEPLLNQAEAFTRSSKIQLEGQLAALKNIDFSKEIPATMNKKMAALNEMLDNLSLYKDMGEFVNYFAKEDKENKDKLLEAATNAKILLAKAKTVHSDYLSGYFKSRGIKDILQQEIELGKIGAEAYTLSKMQTSTGQAFYDINNQKNNIVENGTNDMLHELTKISTDLDTWSGGGAEGLKKYQNLIEKKDAKGNGTNKLIDRFKPEFYSELNKRLGKNNIEQNDIAWVKANVDREAFQKWADEYKISRTEAINKLPIVGTQDVIEQKRQYLLDDLNRVTDLNKDYAWSIVSNVSRFPKTDLWHSNEYKALLNNEPVKTLYDFIQKWNREAASSGYIEYSQARSFLPWVTKSLAEKVGIGGKWNLKDNVLHSLTDAKYDAINERRNPVTGELLNTLPKFFTKDISTKDKEGNPEYDTVSDDLVKNMGLYAHAIMDYKAKSDIEELTDGLLALEKYKGMLEQDSRGKLTGHSIEANSNFKYLEDAIKMHLYGKAILTSMDVKGGVVELNGEEREYSAVRAMDTIKTAYSLSVLGFNLGTSVFRAINTNLMGVYTANNHYTPKQQLESFWDFCALRNFKNDNKLTIGMLKDFLPVEENLHEGINRLSTNKVTGTDFQGVLMKWVKSAHNIVQYTNYLSHVKNAIVVDGKIHNARDYYKETSDYKERYNKSASERLDLEKGFEGEIKKLTDKYGLLNSATFNETTGRVEYKELDLNDASVADWKSLIRVSGRRLSGNISDADQAHMRSNALLRQTMLFTNWLPQQLDIRFGEIAYNKGIDAYEYGRIRMMAKVLLHDGLMNGITNLKNMYKANAAGVEALHSMYIDHKNKYLEKTGKQLDMTPDEYYDMVRNNIKIQGRELLSLVAMTTFAFGLMSALPNKEDSDYDPKSAGYFNFMKRVSNRCKEELQLYYNPVAFVKYADSSKFPPLGYLEDLYNASKSLLSEAFGYAIDDDKLKENAHAIKHVMHTLPIAKEMLEVIKITDPDMSKYLGLHDSPEIVTGKK